MLTDIETSIPAETATTTTEVVFTPNRDGILSMVEAVHEVISSEPHVDMRMWDIIVGLEALVSYLKEEAQIMSLAQEEEAE